MDIKKSVNSLKETLAIVNDALAKGADKAALFCSLSIPDICSLIDNLSKGGNGKVGGHDYARWYNENIFIYENPPSGSNLSQFDGKVLYLLRCKMFHEGSLHHERVYEELKKNYETILSREDKYRDKEVDLRWDLNAKHNLFGITYQLDDNNLPKDKVIITAHVNPRDLTQKITWVAEEVVNNYVENSAE